MSGGEMEQIKRRGPGRPPVALNLKKVPNTIKISQWVTDWLDEHENSKASLVENAITKYYKLKPPLS